MKKNINQLLPIYFCSFFLFAVNGFSQTTAQDYFNKGSKEYYSGNMQNAKKTVLEGLARYPNNAKLNALKEKIDEEDKDQQQDQKQNKDQQNKEKEDKQKQQQQQDSKDKQQDNKKKPEPQQAKISPEQAARLLDAMKKNEKEQLLKRADFQKRNERRKTDKDW